MRKFGNQSGFTLIEVLIAVFALALLLTAGGTMLTSALAGQETVETRSDSLRQLQIARGHLSADINNALPRAVEPLRSGIERQSFFGGRANREGVILGLVRGGWIDPEGSAARGDLVIVEYEVEKSALVRRVWLRPDRTRSTPSFEQPILSGVEAVEVTFFAAGQMANEWDYVEFEGLPVLPQTVRVSITFDNGEVSVQKFLVGRNS